jgi:peptide/nickel transport system substrate-binding protein
MIPRSLLSTGAAITLVVMGANLVAGCRPAASSPSGSGASTGKVTTNEVASIFNTRTIAGTGSGGTLRIGMTAGNVPIPDTPTNEGGEGRRFVGSQIYEGLTRLDTNQDATWTKPVPGMAESWTLSDDQTTWTFKLRQGQKFHDGTPFNAEAVKFGIDRVTDKNAPQYNATLASAAAQQTGGIARVDVVDEQTVNIVTKGPYAFLLWDLTVLLLPSPTAVQTWGKDYVQHASGTGPFKMTKYIDGQVMELEPNEAYWQGKPKLDKVVLLPMPEPAARLAALQSGDIDWGEIPPPNAVAALKDQGFQVITGPYPHIMSYKLNIDRPPFNDARVRQAVNYAVNRDAQVAVIDGFGYPAGQYIHKGHPYYDESWEGYTYNPTKAKELLTEAGYADGFKVRMVYPSSGSGNMWPGPMNERLKADLKAFNIDVELVPMEWNTITTANRAGFKNPDWSSYDIIHISQSLSTPAMVRGFTSFAIQPQGCCNPTGWSRPDVDAMWVEAERTFDVDKQNALLRNIQSAAMQDGYAILTVHDKNLRVMGKNVRNFVQPQAWTVDLYEVYVEK